MVPEKLLAATRRWKWARSLTLVESQPVKLVGAGANPVVLEATLLLVQQQPNEINRTGH